MAITSKNKLTWADIQALYSAINTERARFGVSQVAIPNNPYIAKTTAISDLKGTIEALTSNGYVGTVARTNVTVPNPGTIIKPTEFEQMSKTIANISGVCAYNSSYNSNYYSSDYSSDYDYNSSHNGSDHSHNDSNYDRCDCVGFSFSWYNSDTDECPSWNDDCKAW